MKMFKSILFTIIYVIPLLLTQCKSTQLNTEEETQQTNEIVQNMEMRNPAFAKAKITYNTWVAGIQGGGSGINMQFEWTALPKNLVMKEAYFRGLTARILQSQKGYNADFKSNQNQPQDLIMHGDSEQEAANTPPVQKTAFPEKLTDKQVGIIYEENGKTVCTIINNPIEKPQVAYPRVRPRGEGY